MQNLIISLVNEALLVIVKNMVSISNSCNSIQKKKQFLNEILRLFHLNFSFRRSALTQALSNGATAQDLKTHFDIKSWQQFQAYSSESKKLKLDESANTIPSDLESNISSGNNSAFWIQNQSSVQETDFLEETPLEPSTEAQARVEAEHSKKRFYVNSIPEKKDNIKLNPMYGEKKIVYVTPSGSQNQPKVPRRNHKKRNQFLTPEQVHKFLFDSSIGK